jgi:serine/threonine protein kinase
VAEETINLIRKCFKCQEKFGSDVTVCPNDGAILVPIPANQAPDPFLGTTLGQNYEILSIIGKGGMGVVYKARHSTLDRFVAIKMLKADLLTDENSYLRFQVEAVAASRLTHPNVVAVHDYGIAKTGQPFLIMEYVEGTSLSSLIAEEGALTTHRALPIFVQTCNALEHAHRKSVIHRDVKPSNIILIHSEGEADLVKVVDFGIAQVGELKQEGLKLTKTGEIFGSPIYMSPEQCTGGAVDERTDIYSVGALMYETLTGVAPFMGATTIETIQMKFSEDPKPFIFVRPNGNIPPVIETVVMKALQRDCNRRFATMSQLKNAMEAASQGYGVAASSIAGTIDNAIPSEFAGIDLRKEVEMATLSAHKLKSRAIAARLLSVDKEASAPIDRDKLKSSEQTKRPSSVPVSILLGLVAASVLGGTAWFLLPGLKPKLQLLLQQMQPISVTGKVTSFTSDRRGRGQLAVQTTDGNLITYEMDGRTRLSGKLKRGITAQVFYSKRGGNFHADKITIQH